MVVPPLIKKNTKMPGHMWCVRIVRVLYDSCKKKYSKFVYIKKNIFFIFYLKKHFTKFGIIIDAYLILSYQHMHTIMHIYNILYMISYI